MHIYKKMAILIAFSAVIASGLSAQVKSTITASIGDEQGLDIPKSLVIAQDKQAYSEALKGWYIKDKKANPNRADWFVNAHFGCFVHWGVYSSLAGEWNGIGSLGYGEHIMRSRKIPLAEYKEKVVATFNPVHFNAEEWIKNAKNAGMKYFIITAKHHDGFAMYPSKAYPFDIRQTKMNEDPMKSLRDAAKKYGLKFGFYYSHAFDWEHPDAPGNDWDYNNPGGDLLLHGAKWWENYPEFLSRAEKYVNEKSIPQIMELIKNYHPDILWFDTPHKLPMYLNLKIIQTIREADPTIVVNGRLASVGDVNFGDYANTGDRAAFFRSTPGIWEAIPTTNESYGYNKFDSSHKSPAHFIRLLASAAAKGGNILLNVGPKGDGTIDVKDVAILNQIGIWMKDNSESIYGTTKNPLCIQNWGEITQKGNHLYLHVFRWPENGLLTIGGLKTRIKKAFVLADPKQKALKFSSVNSTDISIALNDIYRNSANTVIKIVCEDSITNVNPNMLLSSIDTNTLLVFDAKTPGKAFSYGDGKTNRNIVTNWINNAQYLQWDVRLNENMNYELVLKYNTAAKTDNGFVVLLVDNIQYKVAYKAPAKTNEPAKITLPSIAFTAGNHTIKLQLDSFTGAVAMQPMEIQLIPLHN